MSKESSPAQSRMGSKDKVQRTGSKDTQFKKQLSSTITQAFDEHKHERFDEGKGKNFMTSGSNPNGALSDRSLVGLSISELPTRVIATSLH